MSTAHFAQALQGLSEELVDTAHGRVFLRCGDIAPGVRLVFVQRHDARPSRTYTQPSDINYAAIALALRAKGCDYVVGICSVGALSKHIPIGALIVADDFYCPFDLRRVYEDARAHIMPGLDDKLRAAVIDIVRSAGYHPLTSGVYVNARGPRFETKAEIRSMAAVGDVVGMTAAHECVACSEVGLPYAMLCMSDNFAHGVQGTLTVESFHKAQAENLLVLERCVQALLLQLPTRAELVATTAPARLHAPALVPAPAPAQGSVQETVLPSPVGASDTGRVKVDLVVHARYVVPMVPSKEETVLDHHSVVVHEGKVVAVLSTAAVAERYTAAAVVSLGASHALIPGLINAHTHAAMNLMRGVADDLPLAQWLSEQIWPTEARLVSPAYVKAGTVAAIAEMIRGGVTTFNDMYFFPDSSAAAVVETGIRACCALVVMEFPTGYAGSAPEYLVKGLAVKAEYAARRCSRLRFTLGPHAPYTVNDATFKHIRQLAEEHGMQVHVHLHETHGEVACSRDGSPGSTKHLSDELCSPLANLDRMGLLSDRLIAVHMTSLTDAEIERVAATNTSVVHCATSNLKLASGFCPVAKLLRAGVNVAIGTDGASSNNSLDMFQEMKLAAVLAKGVAADATAVPAWQALRMATYNGAKALGLHAQVGSLEAGKFADMVAVDLSGLGQQPMYNVLSHLVYATDRAAVTDVWVEGQHLMADRVLLTIDEASVKRDLQKWAEQVRPGQAATDKHVETPLAVKA